MMKVTQASSFTSVFVCGVWSGVGGDSIVIFLDLDLSVQSYEVNEMNNKMNL